jgi:hypothetical protein
MMPHWTSDEAVPPAEFSTKRALNQWKLFQKTHYVGSQEHEVANYLIKELNKLGLETTVQQGYTLSDWGNLVQSKIFWHEWN